VVVQVLHRYVRRLYDGLNTHHSLDDGRGLTPMVFKVGDKVRWRHVVPELTAKDALGTITAVIPNETGVDELTLYEISFDFGSFTLHGAQIEPESQSKAS
jgi:hypothetical protein